MLFEDAISQRWIRGHKAEGQGQNKIRGQGPTFRGQTLSRPRTGMLEAKAKDQWHNAQVFFKKKRSSRKFSAKFQAKKKRS